jgi:malonyl-CoA O-methyltransferase
MRLSGELDKHQVRQSFSGAAESYDSVASLQRNVGLALIKQAGAESFSGTVLDLGCGTGFISSQIMSTNDINQMILLDIALPMLQIAQQKLANHTALYVCADAEQLPLASNTVDHVISNVALQWCRNLDVVFADIKRILKSGGQFSFAIFGSGTLQELKLAWACVDHYQHVNEFYSQGQLEDFLAQAGFNQIQITSECHVANYASAMDLMRELKQLGAHNVLSGRNKQLTTKTQLQKMLAAYERQFVEGSVSATFDVIIVKAIA